MFKPFNQITQEIFFGKIWIYVEGIFFFTSEIGFFGLTWRVLMQCDSTVSLHVSPKNQISKVKKKITYTEIQVLPRDFVSE